MIVRVSGKANYGGGRNLPDGSLVTCRYAEFNRYISLAVGNVST